MFGDLDWPLNASLWFVSISRGSCFSMPRKYGNILISQEPRKLATSVVAGLPVPLYTDDIRDVLSRLSMEALITCCFNYVKQLSTQISHPAPHIPIPVTLTFDLLDRKSQSVASWCSEIILRTRFGGHSFITCGATYIPSLMLCHRRDPRAYMRSVGLHTTPNIEQLNGCDHAG